MTCIKTQSMITPFIDNKLNMKETEAFLDHISTCNNCREELEFYYVLLTAMKQLDEDQNLSEDYRLELASKIEAAQERIIHVKFTYYRKKAFLLLSMLLVTLALSFGYAETIHEQVKTVTESDFSIRIPYRSERSAWIDKQLENYLKGQSLDKRSPLEENHTDSDPEVDGVGGIGK